MPGERNYFVPPPVESEKTSSAVIADPGLKSLLFI
jgi:hypothetical protein